MQQQDIAVWRANSKDDLRDMLKTDKRGLILSMIHKFEGLEKDANTRDNVYVFIDRSAPLGRQGTGHLSDGGRAQRNDHRIHRHAN